MTKKLSDLLIIFLSFLIKTTVLNIVEAHQYNFIASGQTTTESNNNNNNNNQYTNYYYGIYEQEESYADHISSSTSSMNSNDGQHSNSKSQNYTLNYDAIATIIKVTCETNQRLLYKRNCRIAAVNSEDTTQNQDENYYIPPPSIGTCPSGSIKEKQTMFHSKNQPLSQRNMASFFKKVQTLLNLDSNSWSIPIGIYYLNTILKTSSEYQLHKTIPHLTYDSVERMFITSMMLSRRVLLGNDKLEEAQAQIIDEFKITHTELKQMEQEFLQVLQMNYDSPSLSLENILYIPPEQIRRMIQSWYYALEEKVPIFYAKEEEKPQPKPEKPASEKVEAQHEYFENDNYNSSSLLAFVR